MKYRDMKHVTTIFSDMEECDPISLEPLGEHIVSLFKLAYIS